MTVKNAHIKNAILEAVLPSVPFEGWTKELLENAAQECGYAKSMVHAVFPNAEHDAIVHFSHWADEKMMVILSSLNPEAMRVRDRVREAVQARLNVLASHKEAERLAVAFWMRPLRKWKGAKLVWKTADKIWRWAGDTSSDYNHYTKRALLSGVITSTTLYWLNDQSPNHHDTKGFLDRRIDNVMVIGKVAGKFKTA